MSYVSQRENECNNVFHLNKCLNFNYHLYKDMRIPDLINRRVSAATREILKE